LEAALNINNHNTIKQRAKQEIPRYTMNSALFAVFQLSWP
jgi:hypothetical protein